MNKRKIINDPVHGFITIPDDLIYDVIQHPFFQRLRRIKQLGLTDLVYPGALHTRFHHALGAMHLMDTALSTLIGKGYEISAKEKQGALLAILLHDIGHGPFSHVLEHSLLEHVAHEHISTLFMERLNQEFSGALQTAIEIFTDQYPKKWLHQLVSSQLDIDRLDYLNRDSFFTGVVEGLVESERIIKMMEIVDDEIVIQEKGIYSIENFLNARRLMYWQVYLHKTTIAAEVMLIEIIRRAKDLTTLGVHVPASEPLHFFLKNGISFSDFTEQNQTLDLFAQLDDYDIWGGIKAWVHHEDNILSMLCNRLMNRQLFKVRLQSVPFTDQLLNEVSSKLLEEYHISKENLAYLKMVGSLSNAAYVAGHKNIKVLSKAGLIIDIAEASDLPNIKAISHVVTKYYLCVPNDIQF